MADNKPPFGLPNVNLPNVSLPDSQRLAENLSKIAERSQSLVQDFVESQASGGNFQVPDPGIVAKTFAEMTQRLMADPGKLVQAQMSFWQEYMNVWQASARRMMGEQVDPVVKPAADDKRFKDEAWVENAVFDFIKQSYLLAARTIHQTATSVDGVDEKTAGRIEFYTRQFVDAMAPTNFALTNPRVLKETLESGGENLVRGLGNMLDDLKRGKGQLRVKMTDLEAFELGKNVATTPGKVVFQTPLMQLLQYTPTTEEVHKRPLLIVPPWINKFYILDLGPKNSFVKWAVDQGFTVFLISWVNPDAALAEKDFEDYLTDGTLAALDAIRDVTGEKEVNAIAYCLGGTLLMSTLAYLAAKRDNRIKSATCFTTMLDFGEPGELEVFIDEEQIQLIEKHMAEKGYLEGTSMSNVFNMLRANDLIWSFVINNYLLGKDPMAFDLLYWNSDSTRMPAKMHSFYLRNMYQHNKLREPGGITLAGVPIDLRKVKTPVFFLSAKEDHIAPWKSTYRGTQLVGGPVKFVLGGSGHIAGVINPATSKKYGFQTNDSYPASADEWLAGAQQNEGSWWPYWREWVRELAGEMVPARQPGSDKCPPLEDAPGSFVKIRI
ncbi:polyhydroxyalkanoate synthase [Plasticicumulans lactativorans]|uniref:Polyhydroxyalkanoate synthase n=1 Tax=Plasticicumulans lactativorans TaxID=1133106 RepID=A0A4R2L407_9GAMM|nr:class I poly(R)-hydroxyalkanoic acid synthase [Plasticicumulans lactativorans]TCO77318.1 polyhydroxyalkanoate synthase [Plasticicumulans lactativorans]